MELFCATCGTKLEPPAESCPCCGRQIDWDTVSQPLSFVKREELPSASDDENTEAAAGEQAQAEPVCTDEEQPVQEEETQVLPPPQTSDEEIPFDLQLEYLSQQPAPAPLEFSDAVVMCIYAMVPLAGLILLTLVMLFGDEEEQNRKTLAKALLVAHLGLMLLLVLGWFALRPLILAYTMSGYGMLG